jgi:hypothetical protein
MTLRSAAARTAAVKVDGITVSNRASRLIREDGGSLYIWGRGGGPYRVVRVSTQRPEGVEFQTRCTEPIRICVATDVIPGRLSISRLWPFRRLNADNGQEVIGGG